MEVEEVRLQVIVVKEAEGVHGRDVGVVKHLLTLLEVVVAHHLRRQAAVGVLLIDLGMEQVVLKKV